MLKVDKEQHQKLIIQMIGMEQNFEGVKVDNKVRRIATDLLKSKTPVENANLIESLQEVFSDRITELSNRVSKVSSLNGFIIQKVQEVEK